MWILFSLLTINISGDIKNTNLAEYDMIYAQDTDQTPSAVLLFLNTRWHNLKVNILDATICTFADTRSSF